MRTTKSHRRVVATAAAVLLVLATAATASADQGGTRNENACVGREFSHDARTRNGVGRAYIRDQARNAEGPGRGFETLRFMAGEDGCLRAQG